MSKPSKGKSRFGMMEGLSERAAPVEVPEVSKRGRAAAGRSDNELEHFSSYLTKGLKRRLKFAAAAEDRRAFQIIEEALQAYLKEHHPKL